MNVISYALFGYNNDVTNALPFGMYLRGVSFNMKMGELLFPGWKMHLCIDEETYKGFQSFFDYHEQNGKLDFDVFERSELCRMMLWRLHPLFKRQYDRILCRDLDSLISYRERQTVEEWIGSGRIAHAITDHVCHTIPMMGGMVGFQCKEVTEALRTDSLQQLMTLSRKIDYTIKGADQDFLNRYIYPVVKQSTMHHYLNGMRCTDEDSCTSDISDIAIPGVSEVLRDSNHLVEHIGAFGHKADPTLLFLEQYLSEGQKRYYNEIEKEYKEVFYWMNKI